MSGLSFEIDILALLVVIIGAAQLIPLWRWRSTFTDPHILFPDVKSLPTIKTKKIGLISLSLYLLCASLGAFAVALTDPRFFIDNKNNSSDSMANNFDPPQEGIAIYLILDQSGSMKETVVVEAPSGGLYTTSKIDLLKKVSTQFISGDSTLNLSGRPNDLIGLVFFARAAKIMTPLTLDHKAVLNQLNKFSEIQDKDQDGTSIGYAIFKTASLIAATKYYAQELIVNGEPAYTIKNSVMILVTDGLQDPNPIDKGKRLRNMDIPEAAAYAKEQGIRLYIVNIEPMLSTEKFVPYQHIMQRAAELTGGKFYMIGSSQNLEQIYTDIDKIEKSQLPPAPQINKNHRPDLYRRISLAPFLITFALASFLIAITLETLFIRRVP